MAVKICAGSDCIQCDRYGDSAKRVTEEIQKASAAGKMFYCCGEKCIAISKITTVVATSLPGGDEEEDPERPEDPKKPGREDGEHGVYISEKILDRLPVRIRIDSG